MMPLTTGKKSHPGNPMMSSTTSSGGETFLELVLSSVLTTRFQGQRTLNLIKSKDFRQEVGAVAAAEHFATEAVVDRMSFE